MAQETEQQVVRGIDLLGAARYLTSDQYAPAYLATKQTLFDPEQWQRILLASCPRDQLLAALAAATHVAESPAELERWTEQILATLEPDLARPMREALAAPGPRTQFIARQPLLLATRLALTEPIPAVTGTADPRRIATLLAHHAAGDFNNPRPQRRRFPAVGGDEPEMAGLPRSLAMNLVANALFNAPCEFGDLIARTRLYWTTYESQLQRFKPRAPLASMLKEATGGIDLDELLAMAFGLYAHSNSTGWDSAGSLDLAGLGVSAGSVATFLDLFADDAAGFAASFAKLASVRASKPTTPSPGSIVGEWEFVPFESKPLLRLGPTEAIVIDERLLQRRFTQALYWLMHDYEKATHNDKGRNQWTQTYSELVEIHAETLARAFAPVALDGSALFFTEEQIAKLGGANADFGIDFGSMVLVADVVQHQFVVPTRTKADPETFVKDLEKSVIDKAEQLDKTINLLLERTDHAAHPVGRRPTTIVPMVVIGGDFPGLPFVHQLARDYVRSAGYLQQPECTKLLIITLGEFEMLSALVASGNVSSVSDVIEGYLKDSVDGGLTNYLYRLCGGGPVVRAPVIQKALDDALRDIEARLLTVSAPNTTP